MPDTLRTLYPAIEPHRSGYAVGLALSAVLDLPPGAVIVWTLAACALIGAWNNRPADTAAH